MNTGGETIRNRIYGRRDEGKEGEREKQKEGLEGRVMRCYIITHASWSKYLATELHEGKPTQRQEKALHLVLNQWSFNYNLTLHPIWIVLKFFVRLL